MAHLKLNTKQWLALGEKLGYIKKAQEEGLELPMGEGEAPVEMPEAPVEMPEAPVKAPGLPEMNDPGALCTEFRVKITCRSTWGKFTNGDHQRGHSPVSFSYNPSKLLGPEGPVLRDFIEPYTWDHAELGSVWPYLEGGFLDIFDGRYHKGRECLNMDSRSDAKKLLAERPADVNFFKGNINYNKVSQEMKTILGYADQKSSDKANGSVSVHLERYKSKFVAYNRCNTDGSCPG